MRRSDDVRFNLYDDVSLNSDNQRFPGARGSTISIHSRHYASEHPKVFVVLFFSVSDL